MKTMTAIVMFAVAVIASIQPAEASRARRHHHNYSAPQARFIMNNDGHMSWVGPSAQQHERRVYRTAKIKHRRSMDMSASRGPVADPTWSAPAAEPAGRGLTTIPTAAGIDVTVSRDMAPKITGFIQENVSRGKKFRRITCYSTARTHVRRSTHRSGDGCDFHPHPIGALAYKYGLRNGCDFSRVDCMHIDNGIALGLPAGARRTTRVARR